MPNDRRHHMIVELGEMRHKISQLEQELRQAQQLAIGDADEQALLEALRRAEEAEDALSVIVIERDELRKELTRLREARGVSSS